MIVDKTMAILPTKTLIYDAEDLKNFRLESFAGPAELIGWDKAEVRIEILATVRHWTTLFFVEEPVSELEWDEKTLVINRSEGMIHLNSKPNYAGWMNWLNFPKAAFKIYLPKATNTHVHNLFGGNITLKNLNGRHQLNTMGGNIHLESVEGEIRGKTMGGNIKVIACDAQADVSTYGGNVVIDHCKREIKVSTKGGNIKIQHCNGKIYVDTWGGSIKAYDCSGDLKCYTSGGNILFEEIQANVGASTKGGNIKASTKGIPDYFWLETSGGNILVNLPLSQGLQLDVKGSKIKMPPLSGFSGIQKRRRLNGLLNGGGASVNLKTRGGNVTIQPYTAPLVGKDITLNGGNDRENFNIKDNRFTTRPDEAETWPEKHPFEKIRKEEPEEDSFGFKNRRLPHLSNLLYSFFVLIIFVYGISSVFYFSLELMETDSPENAQNTALFLLNITSSVGCFLAVNVFINGVEQKYRSNWKKYLILIVMTAGFVRLGHFFQWIMYTYFPDNQLFWPHYWHILDYTSWNIHGNRGSLLFASIPLLAVSLYFYFWQRSRHFTRKISEQEYQLLSLEKLKTKAQLNALEARINPHFLYNSLNSIAGLVHQDPDKAEDMTIQLSKLFRYTTGRNEGHSHSIAEELEVVKSYLAIEQMRFGNRLRFSIDVAPELLEVKIPRFLLQPIVENAIKHGISQLLEKGKIEIKIENKDKLVQFMIHDNGPAFKEEVGGGYGLRSIRDKLNLIYGQKASLQIQNNEYKAVIVIIPIFYEFL